MTLLLISNTFHASGDFITYRLWTNVTHSSSIYIIHFEPIPHIILVSLLLASTKPSKVFQCFFSQIWKDCIIPRNHPLMTSTINGQFFDPLLPKFTLFKLGQNWKVGFQCFFSQIWKDCIIPRNHPLMTSTINGQFFDPLLPKFTLFKLGQNWKVGFRVSPNSRVYVFLNIETIKVKLKFV